MSVHKIKIETPTEYYAFWQGHKKAVIIDSKYIGDKEFKQWDTVILENDSPKWSDLPIYYQISYLEHITGGLLLHLKK